MEKVGILIVGAGPTGLGAASRLTQHGKKDWMIIDQREEAGGLACTAQTKEGFLFDMGGHVIFSHYVYFDELLDCAMGAGEDAWNTHERVSYVWIKNTWVAYPFQNNIAMLPKQDQVDCLDGLVEAKVRNAVAQSPPDNFDDWILRCMGAGIADLFMRPYNFKVWAIPTNLMQCGWLGERVATVNISRAINNVIEKKEDAGWGPNAVFRFPTSGGTGAIWKAVSKKLIPIEKQRYGSENKITSLDIQNKTVTLKNGNKIQYEALISTIPLDITLQMVGKKELGDRLTYSSSHIVGVGIRGTCPHGKKCWLYYPEDNCPFYRTTVFSNYAKKNCPDDDVVLPTICMGDGSTAITNGNMMKAGPYWSLMFEISESEYKPVDQQPVNIGKTNCTWPKVVLDTLEGAINTKLVTNQCEVVSLYHTRLEHGYPTPSLERDSVINEALPWLKQQNVWSRGRFGSYKYEVANQDHSCMLGVEAVDNILFGTKEITLNHPNIVNPKKNEELHFQKLGLLN